MPKVVIIGAGSLVFSRRLQADILSFENLRNTHFCLVEIDEERLGDAQPITEQLLKTGVYPEATFEATTERRTVLAGADYVISSLLVGGYEAIEAEIDIPKKYGVDQCISDTLTPGGIMHSLRTLPHQIGIALDIMELCPKAVLLNYTKPLRNPRQSNRNSRHSKNDRRFDHHSANRYQVDFPISPIDDASRIIGYAKRPRNHRTN